MAAKTTLTLGVWQTESVRSAARHGLAVIAWTVLTVVAARIEVPFYPVPFTLQSLAVLLAGAHLGWRGGLLSQALYVAAGLAGLPVFAQGKVGLPVILGPTGGYLLGFMAAAVIVGALLPRVSARPLARFGVMFLGSAVLLGIGGLYLAGQVGVRDAVMLGIVPFLLGEVVKSWLAAAVVGRAHQLGA